MSDPIPDLQELVRSGSGPCFYVSIQDSIQDARRLLERLAEVTAERDRLSAVIQEIGTELYGHGFQVLGWHLNGDTEPLDSWFEDNHWLELGPGNAAEAAGGGE